LIAVKEIICKHPVGAIQRAYAINENINEMDRGYPLAVRRWVESKCPWL